MYIEINGVNLTSLTTKYGYEQTLEKRQGVNAGTDGNGNPIEDVLGTAYTITWNISPCTASTVKVFADIAKQSKVLLKYFSAADNATKTVYAKPTLETIPLVLKTSSKEIYYGMTLTLETYI